MRVQRKKPADRLTRGDDTLLLYEERVVRLAALGTALFDLTEHEADVESLAAALELIFGPPASGTTMAATLAAIDAMIAQGVLMARPEADT